MRIKFSICFILVCFGLSAQVFDEPKGFKNRIIYSLGTNTGYFQSNLSESVLPASAYTQSLSPGADWENGTTDLTLYRSLRGFRSVFFVNFRYNIFEIDDENSFSLDLEINGGKTLTYQTELTGSDSLDVTTLVQTNRENGKLHGLLSFGMPIYILYNHGVGSTFSTIKDRGIAVGVGLENIFASLGNFNGYKENRLMLLPTFKFASRWWSKDDNLREIAFKFGLGPSYPQNLVKLNEAERKSWEPNVLRSMFIGINLHYYINY